MKYELGCNRFFGLPCSNNFIAWFVFSASSVVTVASRLSLSACNSLRYSGFFSSGRGSLGGVGVPHNCPAATAGGEAEDRDRDGDDASTQSSKHDTIELEQFSLRRHFASLELPLKISSYPPPIFINGELT